MAFVLPAMLRWNVNLTGLITGDWITYICAYLAYARMNFGRWALLVEAAYGWVCSSLACLVFPEATLLFAGLAGLQVFGLSRLFTAESTAWYRQTGQLVVPDGTPAMVKSSAQGIGCGAYFLGVLALLPVLGIAFISPICIAVGLSTARKGGKVLAVLGVMGILTSIGVFAPLFYHEWAERAGPADSRRVVEARKELDLLVIDIETYKVKNGAYPEALDDLYKDAPEGTVIHALDPTVSVEPTVRAWAKVVRNQLEIAAGVDSTVGEDVWPQTFQFERLDATHYRVFGKGIDGKANTSDDLAPSHAAEHGTPLRAVQNV